MYLEKGQNLDLLFDLQSLQIKWQVTMILQFNFNNCWSKIANCLRTSFQFKHVSEGVQVDEIALF